MRPAAGSSSMSRDSTEVDRQPFPFLGIGTDHTKPGSYFAGRLDSESCQFPLYSWFVQAMDTEGNRKVAGIGSVVPRR